MTTYTIEGHNHQMRTEIYRPSGATTVLAGEGTIKLDDLKARLDLTHDGKSYSTAVEYMYDFKPRKIEMSGKYDLTIPQRHIALEGEVSAAEKLYSASVSTMWDADRDASKKVSLNGRLTMNPGNYVGSAKVVYPGREINLNANQEINEQSMTHHSELTWAAGKGITVDVDGIMTAISAEGKLKVSTPFFTDVTINANAEKARQETKGHFDIDYGKTISADFSVTPKAGWRNMEGSITLHTPFKIIERLAISGSHDLTSTVKTAKLEVSRNTRSFTINGNLMLTEEKKEGMVEMNMNGKNAKVTFTNTLTENELIHNSEVILNGNSLATVDLKGGIRPAETWMQSKLLTSWTPDFEMNADIKKGRQELSSHIDITCVESLSADASLKMISGWQHMESSVTIHTPLQGYERLVLTENHDIVGDEKSIHWSVARNTDAVVLTGYSKIDQSTMEASLKLTTPFETVQTIAVSGNGLYDGANFNSHIEAEMMNKKVELDVNGKVQGSSMDANGQLKTPFTQPIAVSVSVNKREPTLHAEFEWQGKKIELDLGGHNKVGYNTRDIKANLGLKTPYTNDLTVSVSHQMDGNQCTSNGMIQWGKKKGSVDFTMTHEMNSGKLNNKGTLVVVTPLQSASASWDQDIEGLNNIISKNELEWSGKKMELSLTHRMAFTSYEHQLNTELSVTSPFHVLRSASASVAYLYNRAMLQADASFQHNSQEYASLSALFNSGRKLTGSIAFKSVIPKAEDLSLTMEMEQGTGNIEVKWAPGKTIVIQNQYNVQASGFNTVTTLTTPFRSVKKVTVDTVYKASNMKDDIGLTIEYAPRKAITAKMGYGKGDGFASNLIITAPCPYFRSFSLSTDNNIVGDQIQHTSDFNFVMDGTDITYTGQLSVNGVNDISGTASITTPFRAVRSQSLSLEHHLQQSEYVSKLTYQLNSQNVDIETHFMNTPAQFKLSGDCKTSFAMVPSVSMSINHQGQGSFVNGQIQLDSQIARTPVSLTATYNVEGVNSISGNLELRTPFYGAENVGGKFSHEHQRGMFTTTAEVQMTPNRKLTFSNEFSMIGGVHLAATVSSPFRAFKGVTINIDHSGDQTGFDTKTKVSTEIRKGSVEVTGNLKWTSWNIDGLLELTTPFRNAGRYALTIKNEFEDGSVMKMNSDCLLEYPGTKIQIHRDVVATNDDISEVVTFSSPFRGFENIRYETNVKHLTRSELTYDMTLTYAPQKKIEAEFKLNSDSQSGSLQIDTPYTTFSHLYIEAGHLGRWSDFKTNLKGEITLSHETYSAGGNVAFKYSENSLSTNIKAESSFDAFREAEVSLRHVTKTDRKFETTFSANLPGYQASATSNLNMASLTDLSGELTLSGPKVMKINFNHKGDHKAFTNHVDCSIDGTTVGTYDGSLTTTLPISAKFEFRSDRYHRLYQVTVDAKGEPTDMTITFDVQFAPETRATIHGSTNWKLASGLKAGMEISAPALMKDVKITIDHEGTNNFNHKTEASYGKKTITLTGNLNTNPTVEGQMELRTPFRVVKLLTADLKFSGNLRKFFTSFSFEHNKVNTASAQVTFDSTNKIGGNVNFESSFMNGFTAEINQVADWPELTTTANIKYKSMSINLDVRITPTDGHFKLQTPWTYFEDVAVSYTHTGPWKNFENNVEMKYNGNTQFVTATKFHFGIGVVGGSIDITTPFTEVRTLSAVFSHELRDRILETTGSVKINDDMVSASVNGNLNPWEFTTAVNVEYKSININLDVAFSPAEGHFKLKTPWQYVEDIVVTFTHSGPWKNFHNNVDIKYNGNTYVTAATKFQISRVIEGSIDLTLPFTKLKTLSVEFSHKLTDRILRSSGSVRLDGEEISASVNFNLSPLDGIIKINMPHHETVVTLKHSGDLSAFENSATFECSRFTFGKLEYSGKWSSSPNTGMFVLKSEKLNCELVFEHAGDTEQFKNSLSLGHPGDKVVEFKGEFTSSPTVEGLFSIESYGRPEIKLQFNHDSSRTSFALSNKLFKNIDVSGSLQRGSSIEGDFKLTTPFEHMKSLEISVKHEQPFKTTIFLEHNDIGRFRYTGDVRETANELTGYFTIISTNKWLKNVEVTVKKDENKVDVEFSHDMVGTIECSGSLQTDPHFVGSFSLKTPYSILKNVQLTAMKDDSKVDVEFSHNKLGTMKSSGAIQMEPIPMGTFELRTPYKIMRNVQLTVKNEDSRIDTEFSHNLVGRMQCSCSLQTDPYPMASFELKTPFTVLQNVALNMKAQPIEGGYHMEAGFDHNLMGSMEMSSKVQKRFSMEGKPVLTANLAIKTPFDVMKNLDVDFMHEFTLSGCHTNVIINPNGIEKLQLDASMEMFPKFTSKFEITTPWKYLETLSVTAQAEGSLTSFKTNMEFNHNILGTALYEGNFEPWRGNFLFQSRCPYLTDLQLNFDHSISSGELKSETGLGINGYTFKATVNGQVEPIDVMFKIELPTTSAEVHATFDGSLCNFQSGLELSKDNRQLIKTGLKLDITSGVTVELQLSSPFIRPVDLTYTHTGNLKQFTCTGLLKIDGQQRFSGDLSVATRSNEVEINIQTSLKKLRNLRVLANFDGELNNFKSAVDVTYNGNNYKTDVTFSLTPSQGNLQLETNFPLLQSLNMNFDHTGDMSDFQSSAQVALNNFGNYKTEVEFKANPMAGSVTLTTPLKGAKKINAAFTHSGDNNQMEDHVEVTVGGKKYAVDSTLKRRPFELEAIITTPIRQYEEIGLKFNQKGNMKTLYNAHGEITYKPGKKVELDIKYKFYSRLVLNVDLQTPFKNMALFVKHQFQGDDLTCQAELTYGTTKAFAGSLNLNVGALPNGKLQITTALPGFEELTIEFSHQMNGQAVSSQADANLFGTHMSGKIDYNNGKGKVQITTPFRGYEEIVAEINHEMTKSMLTSEIKGSVNGRQISASVTGRFMALTDMEVTAEIRTPFAWMDYIKLYAKQEGGLDNMKTELAVVLPKEYSIEGTFTLQTTTGFSANLKTNLRGFEDVAITFDHTSNRGILNTLAQIQYSANQAVTLKIDLSKGAQSLDGTLTFTSPFRRFRSLAAEIHHGYSGNNLESKVLLSWDDRKEIVASVMYQSDNGIPVSGSITLNAPFINEKSVEFTNNIQSNSIESIGKMTWSPSKTIQMTLRASYNGDRTALNGRASLELTTPFSLLREVNIVAEHEHSSSTVENSVTIDFNRNRVMDSKVSLNKKTGTVTITGPFKVLLNYNNNRNGGSFNMAHPFEVDASYTRDNEGLSMTMLKPYTMDATYKHDTKGGSVVMNGPLKVDGTYTLSREGGSLNLRKPFQIDVLATYTGNIAVLQMENPVQIYTRAEINRDGGSFVMTEPFAADASYTYNRNGGSFTMQNPFTVDASYSLSRNGASVSMKQPYPVEASYTLSRDGGAVSMTQPFSVEARYEYTGNAGSFSMDKPYQVHGSFELTPSGATVEMTKPYAVDAAYNMDQTGGSVSMRNPIRVDAGYTVNVDGHSLNINSPIKVNAEYKWFGNGGSFVMTNPVAIDVEGKLTPTEGYLKMTNPYPIDTSYSFNWNSASLKMLQPYPIDVAYEVSPKKGSVVMQQPYPVDISYMWSIKKGYLKMDMPLQMEASYALNKPSLNDLDGSIIVNWNKASSTSNVKVEVMHKDTSTRYSLVKQGSIRAVLPTRTISLALDGEKSAIKFKQSTEVTWDEARDRKVSYMIDYNRASASAMDATATIVTPIRSMEGKFVQSRNANDIVTEANLHWDSSRDRSKALTVKNVLQQKNAYTRSSETTIICPAFTRVRWSCCFFSFS